MPDKDPKVLSHHCRLGRNSPELRAALSGLKGVCVVSHAGGETGEHPHLHCWFQHDKETTAGTVKNRLHKLSAFSDFKGNSDWSFRSHNDLPIWWEYVWRDSLGNKKPELVCWTLDIPEFPIPVNPPTLIVAEMEAPGNIIAKGPIHEFRKKSKQASTIDKQNKFLAYCKGYYDLDETEAPTPRKVLKLLYDYCAKNGFTTETCCFVYVNYALSNLCKGDAYKEGRRRFVDRLEGKFF